MELFLTILFIAVVIIAALAINRRKTVVATEVSTDINNTPTEIVKTVLVQPAEPVVQPIVEAVASLPETSEVLPSENVKVSKPAKKQKNQQPKPRKKPNKSDNA
jgi:hypothetical protein